MYYETLIEMGTSGMECNSDGAIHESVLWFFGQCLVYAGSVLGVASYISVRG